MDRYYISVRFENNNKSYYFSCDTNALSVDDNVIVETTIGKEIGRVAVGPKLMSGLNFDKEIKPILRRAVKSDLVLKEENKKLADEAAGIFTTESEKLNLNMRLISAEYTLDRAKILFTYSSDDRIDFRELLKILASQLHCRIELKQITSRERAQLIGGIGVCGLPLCCTTFFTTFEGISLNRAKNQMLAINIPKLSGQCGKLLCCLKYEDDQYTELKKQFPPLNSTINYMGEDYKITGINLFTKVLKIENKENVNFINISDLGPKNKQIEKKVFQTPKQDTNKNNNAPKNVQNNNVNKQNNNNKQQNNNNNKPVNQANNKQNNQPNKNNNKQNIQNNNQNKQNNQNSNQNRPNKNKQHFNKNKNKVNNNQNNQKQPEKNDNAKK
ncbi:MAG: stage 0 sporulation protein [Mollicutes bacterium]|nr:stage 0 sporulation protein [Mollicutes bacterium]MDD7264593.1 regulatory iron-sulfur-containing complex subunit RicT [bacterium]MDY4979857.1 regulatory iron-sulfur-containing complex subunit RicT [Candidatus Onthovivens sp.]